MDQLKKISGFLVLMSISLIHADFFEEGQILFKQGQYEKAKVLFRKAVVANPLHGESMLSLGHCFFALGRYTEAEECFRRGIDFVQNPDFPLALPALFPNRLTFLKFQNDLQQKVKQYPYNVRLKAALGYSSYFSEQREEAKLIFHRLIRRHPKDSYVQFFVDRLNREDKARFLKFLKKQAELKKNSEKTSAIISSKKTVKLSPLWKENLEKNNERESLSKEKTKNTFSR